MAYKWTPWVKGEELDFWQELERRGVVQVTSISSSNELVGVYVRLEQIYARLKWHNQLDMSGEEDFRSPVNIEMEAQMNEYLAKLRPFLPDWFIPDYVMQIDDALRGLFFLVTDFGNQQIEKRRELGMSYGSVEAKPFNAAKAAYENCRRLVYKLAEIVTDRRKFPIDRPPLRLPMKHIEIDRMAALRSYAETLKKDVTELTMTEVSLAYMKATLAHGQAEVRNAEGENHAEG